MKKLFGFLLFIIVFFLMNIQEAKAVEQDEREQMTVERMHMFQHMEGLTGVPWYYLAAIDQFERNIQKVRKDIPGKKGIIAITVPTRKWSGFLNPMQYDTHPSSILFFNGLGRDGSGDGKADPENDLDVLYSMARYISEYGFTEDDVRIALWEYYKRDKTVEIISEFAKLYRTFQTLKLEGHVFPIPLNRQYNYRSTWGYARGWGGRRIHEGTDIFAYHGTPVRSTSYGVVEVMGWNRYGGWRVGIRDLDNIYHYYAHLSRFNKDLKEGDVVKPGDVIGYVGSSGYGSPGTSGKFPPHLHYGMYKDNGIKEWSFDPYPRLKAWERQEKKRKRDKK
ncbi:MAG: M23 family metallopeptidase [Bacillaceae bacterium]|nr:M23 family metallopeptidase [Bacillaceae bacterium]